MEPDTLATPSDELSARLPASEQAASASAPPVNGHAPTAASPPRRPVRNRNGNGIAHDAAALPHVTNGNGATLGHPLPGARAVAAAPAVHGTGPALVELELRAARSFYLRTGKRILDFFG